MNDVSTPSMNGSDVRSQSERHRRHAWQTRGNKTRIAPLYHAAALRRNAALKQVPRMRHKGRRDGIQDGPAPHFRTCVTMFRNGAKIFAGQSACKKASQPTFAHCYNVRRNLTKIITHFRRRFTAYIRRNTPTSLRYTLRGVKGVKGIRGTDATGSRTAFSTLRGRHSRQSFASLRQAHLCAYA